MFEIGYIGVRGWCFNVSNVLVVVSYDSNTQVA